MLVIPIFIPHWGCPHQCSFCNQKFISGAQYSKSSFAISFHQTIETYLSYKGSRSTIELAFFGGNFLGLSKKIIANLMDLLQPYLAQGLIHKFRCSTRPDTIREDTIKIIKNSYLSLVEIGVQSMDDKVLLQCMRGHTRQDSLDAIDCLERHKIKSGVQVIAGLPGESRRSFIDGVKELAGRHPATARIYPLVVLSESPLAIQYKKGSYQPLELSQAVEWSKEAYEIFSNAGVKVIRMGLQASDMLSDPKNVLAGPYHPAFGHLVFSSLLLDRALEAIDECLHNKAYFLSGQENICLLVHPRSESRLRGHKNINIVELKTRFPDISFLIVLDSQIPVGEVKALTGSL